MIDRSGPAAIMLLDLLSEQITPGAVPSDLWVAITQLAMEHDFGPMMLWLIKQGDSEPLLEPLIEVLRQETRINTLRYLQQKNAQMDIDAALRAHGILPLWFKGIALANTVYPQPALRKMQDLDVLIPQERMSEAYDILVEMGYRLIDHVRFELLDQLMQDYHMVDNSTPPIHLELHHGLLGYVGLDLVSPELLAWFWEQREEITVEDMTFTTFKPEAHFFYLCAHAFLQHGEGEIDLKHIFDLHMIVKVLDLDWDTIIAQASAYRWTYAIERALTSTAERFATPMPENILERLRAVRPPDENTRTVKRFRTPGLIGRERTLMRLMQLPWKDKFGLIRLILFLPRNRMRAAYHIPPGRPVLPYYPWRWLLLAIKTVRAIWWRLRNK